MPPTPRRRGTSAYPYVGYVGTFAPRHSHLDPQATSALTPWPHTLTGSATLLLLALLARALAKLRRLAAFTKDDVDERESDLRFCPSLTLLSRREMWLSNAESDE